MSLEVFNIKPEYIFFSQIFFQIFSQKAIHFIGKNVLFTIEFALNYNEFRNFINLHNCTKEYLAETLQGLIFPVSSMRNLIRNSLFIRRLLSFWNNI